MNIVSTLPECIKPKNVGLMFFSMEPDKFFPYTQIDVVQFPSGLGGDDIIEKTFKGPIQQQLRDALQYICNVVITEKVIKHPDRAEADRFFNFPYAAIEEALSNAVHYVSTQGNQGNARQHDYSSGSDGTWKWTNWA
jgi:ATP-dependent DNA helicase RecG